jgi:competence protein ComEC
MLLTHGDPDHIGGAPAIVRAFRPGVVWEGVPVPPHPWLRSLSDAADAIGLRWRTVQAGDQERVGAVRIRVLHPPLPDWERQRVRNEDSIVLDVRIGDVSIVLPGDIGGEGESALLDQLEPSRIVVLKAPHHGSATSSSPALVAALRPAGCGLQCREKQPIRSSSSCRGQSATTQRQMFSTAEDGAVILDTVEDGYLDRLDGETSRLRSPMWGAAFRLRQRAAAGLKAALHPDVNHRGGT